MKHKFLFILSLFALTSCGTKVHKLGSYGLDHSAYWNDNYFTYYDESLRVLPNEIVMLDKDQNKVFTSFNDDNFLFLEEKAGVDLKYDDINLETGFGPVMKLSNHNTFVKEGVTSKLFDGQLFCHGYFEAARVQIKESGITVPLGHKLASSDYLYLNFKSALNFKANEVSGHLDNLTINITFYNNEKGITYSYPLVDVPTNQGETYIFYGFSLKDLNLNNASSVAITYHLDKESYNEEKGLNIEHALLLYEFGFKNPIFE